MYLKQEQLIHKLQNFTQNNIKENYLHIILSVFILYEQLSASHVIFMNLFYMYVTLLFVQNFFDKVHRKNIFLSLPYCIFYCVFLNAFYSFHINFKVTNMSCVREFECKSYDTYDIIAFIISKK